jgi:hypothetical protein
LTVTRTILVGGKFHDGIFAAIERTAGAGSSAPVYTDFGPFPGRSRP